VRAFAKNNGVARLVRGNSGRHPAAVAFPCSLSCENFQLSPALTLFFVIKPLAFEPGDQAVGQRFFGHYPFGQFRFRDGRIALRGDSSEYVPLFMSSFNFYMRALHSVIFFVLELRIAPVVPVFRIKTPYPM